MQLNGKVQWGRKGGTFAGGGVVLGHGGNFCLGSTLYFAYFWHLHFMHYLTLTPALCLLLASALCVLHTPDPYTLCIMHSWRLLFNKYITGALLICLEFILKHINVKCKNGNVKLRNHSLYIDLLQHMIMRFKYSQQKRTLNYSTVFHYIQNSSFSMKGLYFLIAIH